MYRKNKMATIKNSSKKEDAEDAGIFKMFRTSREERKKIKFQMIQRLYTTFPASAFFRCRIQIRNKQ